MYERLVEAYGPEYLATMLLERYSKIQYVREFQQQIGESIKAYFCGCIHPAVTGLIPVFEGSIRRRFASEKGRDMGHYNTSKKISAEVDAFVEAE